MAKPIIEVDHLSKLYRLGEISPLSVRESVDRLWNRMRGKTTAPSPASREMSPRPSTVQMGPQPNTFWALKDVCFHVRPGEIVGVIGRNGAGKSTLLKVLSRITEPSQGRAILRGRVASLLEVGTGFHPELTGRENIFLNGSILGMRTHEIRKKFDEIVAFAEIDQFLDTPVKHYSSGMYVRLGFAIAAHLEPEILLVDEVLAVGDIGFQQKCLGKIDQVAKNGKTILFVSHNLSAVQSLCERTLLVQEARIVSDGNTGEVIGWYLDSLAKDERVSVADRGDRQGDRSVKISAVSIQNADGAGHIGPMSRLKISLEYESGRDLTNASFLIGIYDIANVGIYLLASDGAADFGSSFAASGEVVCVTDPIRMTPGRCFVNVAVLKGGVIADHVQRAACFDVVEVRPEGHSKLPRREWMLGMLGHQWQVRRKGAGRP